MAEVTESVKAIRAAKNKAWREANKEALKEKRKVYLEANKAEIKARIKAYQEANKEKIKERVKARSVGREDELRARRQAYYLENKDKPEHINKIISLQYLKYIHNNTNIPKILYHTQLHFSKMARKLIGPTHKCRPCPPPTTRPLSNSRPHRWPTRTTECRTTFRHLCSRLPQAVRCMLSCWETRHP
jgi:hypothetical protein